jgi:hypothetical protein
MSAIHFAVGGSMKHPRMASGWARRRISLPPPTGGPYLNPPVRALVLCCDEKRLDEKAEEAAIEGVGKLDAL